MSQIAVVEFRPLAARGTGWGRLSKIGRRGGHIVCSESVLKVRTSLRHDNSKDLKSAEIADGTGRCDASEEARSGRVWMETTSTVIDGPEEIGRGPLHSLSCTVVIAH